jgi:hypothetical protein
LLRYFDGFSRNKDQSVIDALRRYLGEQQPQAQPQPQAEAQGEAQPIARDDYVGRAREFVARVGNLSPSQYGVNDYNRGLSLVMAIVQDARGQGFIPRFDQTSTLQKIYSTIQQESPAQKLNALNDFILNYGEDVDKKYGADVGGFLDLVVRVLQKLVRDSYLPRP